MSDTAPVLTSHLPLPLLHRGKVRDVYEVDADTLLMVASDRVSAFDVVMGRPIPRKGEVLTLITAWWLSELDGRLDHHLLAVDPDEIVRRHPALASSRDGWARRAMLVRRTTPVLVECVIRGYIAGSAWKEYRTGGTLAGEPLPPGLQESSRLDPPIFSPATKAQEGHDENIPFSHVVDTLGADVANLLLRRSMEVYEFGRDRAAQAGIILADTKFEFGFDGAGRLLLIDEVMTPDSSRFWPQESYAVGRGQPSLDKQPIRDWLDSLEDWDKTPPPPELTDEVVDSASRRYMDIFQRLTGSSLDAFTLPHFGDDA
ncbi:MAG: phosphoribosylaminoimidazolesuccinocarboxamide synthase [Gemmatimonadota bacterium]|nr:phosphoribosylaminoimidazolesuccinocarboxamide synthase [Gemmatimonadota bacterium]MDH5758386.1 phosphoribosylaminoimidazolesuccinocarboxamide synthase [Gemmatimonadota bacterium]